jgi:hypothetical protein
LVVPVLDLVEMLVLLAKLGYHTLGVAGAVVELEQV